MNFEEPPELHNGIVVSRYTNNSVKVREEWTDKEYTSLESYDYFVGDKVVFFLEIRKIGPVAVVLHKQSDKPKKNMSGWV